MGDRTTLKVHVHTDDPDAATAVFAGDGTISHLDIADMREQIMRRSERLEVPQPPQACGALAVTSGDGMRNLFESLGVTVLDGGPTLNPSTFDLLAAIHAIAAEAVVVLPNSPNVVMAAERAADLSEKSVEVVPTRSQQTGLVAAVGLDPARSATENAAAMRRALDGVRTGAVAPAARDDVQGRFRRGEAVGFVDEEIVVWGAARETLRGVLERLADHAELITCLRGAGAPLDDATVHAVPYRPPDGGRDVLGVELDPQVDVVDPAHNRPAVLTLLPGHLAPVVECGGVLQGQRLPFGQRPRERNAEHVGAVPDLGAGSYGRLAAVADPQCERRRVVDIRDAVQPVAERLQRRKLRLRKG